MLNLSDDAVFATHASELATLAASGEKISLSKVAVACMAIGRAYALCSTPDRGSNTSRTLTVTKTEIAEKLSALGAGNPKTFQAYLGLADSLCGFTGRGKARAARYPELYLAALEGRRKDVEAGIASIGRTVRDLREALRPKASGEAAKEKDAAKVAARRARRVAEAIGDMSSPEEAVEAIKAALAEAGLTMVKVTMAKAKA